MKEFGSNQSGDKDVEVKRPPWRAVSVSTLPKPDKNAILRAKLLDASRRLRSGKSSIGLQTLQVPAKSLRDVNLGTQKDLLLFKDMEIQTHGFYTKKKNNGETFVLTYSVAQMTDYVRVSNAATQTLLPKIPGDIFLNNHLANYRNIKHLKNVSNIQKNLNGEDCVKQNKKLYPESDGSFVKESVHSEYNIRELSKKSFMPRRQQPTLLSWNFEYGDLSDYNNSRKFVPYIMQAKHSRRSINSLPTVTSAYDDNNHFYIDNNWKMFLLSVDELLQEINLLIDFIEDDISIKKFYNDSSLKWFDFNNQQLVIPSEKWLPLVNKEEKQLEEMMKKLMR